MILLPEALLKKLSNAPKSTRTRFEEANDDEGMYDGDMMEPAALNIGADIEREHEPS